MIDQKLADLLMQSAIPYVTQIHNALRKDENLSKLSDKQLTIAVLTYAAGLANLTDLKDEDYLSLSMYALNNVVASRDGEVQPEPENTEPVAESTDEQHTES